jgi:ADP-ribosylglycohydrolase
MMKPERTEIKKTIFGGIIGLCVADALGVPVEFESRESLAHTPVTDMLGYGTYNQPLGTWSDDTSLTLCLLDSLTAGLDYTDIMSKFTAWHDMGEYTPYGESFDIGRTTKDAILRFAEGTEPLMCGGRSERDAGNGSLMRILPLAFYLHSLYGDDFIDHDEAFDIIHNVSSLTHAHKRCLIACGIYISIAGRLLAGNDIERAVHYGLQSAKEYYESRSEYREELDHFERIFGSDFKNLPQESIKSSGYVVDTLEAAIWCILNTGSYQNCVLKAINLGEDTDTVAAVAGGLVGMGYDISSSYIPEEWMSQIARLDYIKDLCLNFYLSLRNSSH